MKTSVHENSDAMAKAAAETAARIVRETIARKGQATFIAALGDPNRVGPMFPASILRRHPSCFLFLDRESASPLSATTLSARLPCPLACRGGASKETGNEEKVSKSRPSLATDSALPDSMDGVC